ncbi:MAG: ABC transporter ATP-binding protein [Sporolactobacillus sp.]
MVNEGQPAVRLEHVTKQFGRKRAVDDLSFDINPGEVFGFLGPNGAGKTTTIRMLVGLMRMSSGNILIQGRSIKGDFKRAISEVGAIVENPEMYKFLTGYQNLVHYARMIPGIDRKRIDEVVDFVRLDKAIHEKVKKYSLGMRQRLGVAQALLHRPSVLVLDEPTNGLDPQRIHDLRNHLHALAHEQGVAVIVSSHLLSEMQLMCDRIGIIQKGQLIGVQTVNEFVDAGGEQLHVVTGGAAAAVQALKDKLALEARADGDMLELTVGREQIPQVVSVLVAAGVSVYEVSAAKKSLEERFLEVTGGKSVE